jgi:hypothetical protein
MQQAFDDTATNVLNMLGMCIPIMPDIAAKICLLAFEMTNEDDFTTGIHPFTFGYQDQAEIAAAYEQIEQYLLLQQGQGAPTLAKAAQFLRPTCTKLSQMLMEATIGYGNFHVAIHVLLGDNHPVMLAYDQFWMTWNASQNYLLNICTHTPGLFPALTVQ